MKILYRALEWFFGFIIPLGYLAIFHMDALVTVAAGPGFVWKFIVGILVIAGTFGYGKKLREDPRLKNAHRRRALFGIFKKFAWLIFILTSFTIIGTYMTVMYELLFLVAITQMLSSTFYFLGLDTWCREQEAKQT